jgi:glucokinase
MEKKNFFIGVDIGGSKVVVALIDKTGKMFYREQFPTKDYIKPLDLINKLSSIIKNLCKENKNIKGVGIGSAGIINSKSGIIKFSPNIGWRNFNIKKMLHDRIKLPIFVDNDANAAAWGIYYLNYNKKYNDVLCVTLGTGVGGGVILNGQLYRGANGYAGEIGHVTLVPKGLLCTCGNYGCIERYTGTRGIIERMKTKLKNGCNSTIKLKDDITPKMISEAAKSGDLTSIDIWKETGEMLGIIFASLVNLLNLELIYITGGISHAEQWIKKPIKDTIFKRAFHEPAKTVKIEFGKQKKDMGVIGAGLLVIEKDFDSCNCK